MKGWDPRGGVAHAENGWRKSESRGKEQGAQLICLASARLLTEGDVCTHSDITRQVRGRNPHSSVCTDAWGYTWD